MPGTSAGEAKPEAKLSKKQRARQAKTRKRRDREVGSDDEDLGARPAPVHAGAVRCQRGEVPIAISFQRKGS